MMKPSLIKQIEFIGNVLDRKFNVFGFKFGIDPIIGIIPVIGDILPALVSAYMVVIGVMMKIDGKDIFIMIRNIIVDLLLGLIPFVGDVSDFFYQSNSKNLAILKKYKDRNVLEGEVVK